jgi:BirA family biotin operon repressor/biotin-[acetyl-CoA-carboxylase] ligase
MQPSVDSTRLAELLAGSNVWTSFSSLLDTGSTNADLAAAARLGAPSGVVMVADHQRAGRGRFNRRWEAPPGSSLALSVLLRPPAAVPPARWMWLPLITGLAVAAGLRRAAGVDARVKWPNDVLIEGRKVCGILAERVDPAPETGLAPAAVLGMGINISLTEAELPVPTATSLRLAGSTAAPTEVVAGVLLELAGEFQAWADGVDVRRRYAVGCDTVGRPVRVLITPTESVTGEAVDVDPAGRLLVRHAGGTTAFAAGDVHHLR